MKTPIQLAAIAGIGVLFISPVADASYQGLGVRLHTTAQVNGINRDVWRIYAVFSDPGDWLTSVAGSPTLGNLTVQTINAFGNAPGGNFVNPAGGSATAPTYKVLPTQLEWDTFVTIGLAFVPEGVTDSTGLSPGFAGIKSFGHQAEVLFDNRVRYVAALGGPRQFQADGLL